MRFSWAPSCLPCDRCSDGWNALVRNSRDCEVGETVRPMAFRIETAARGELTVFILSGRIEHQAVAELRKLFEGQTDRGDIVLDLKDVGVIDREAMRFLARCEADGVQLENCTPYIREWMEREKD